MQEVNLWKETHCLDDDQLAAIPGRPSDQNYPGSEFL